MQTTIRSATANDSAALARIYNYYIRETVITFEEVQLTTAEMAARVAGVAALALPWIVAERDGAIIGYAYAGKWKERSAYRYSVESTVYLDPQHTGQGLGTRLYESLLKSLRATPVHAVIGGIALPNAASVALHEKLGFRRVGQFTEVGFKFGQWIDVGYWQFALGTSAAAASA